MSFDNFSKQEMMSEINVTPLVDVMLVLLVVFIITAPLLAPQSLKISLPKTVAVASSNDKPLAARLVVNAHGDIELDQETVNDTQLSEKLKLRATDTRFQIQIEADQAVPYGRVAEILAIAQGAGVSKLSFITLLDN